MTRSILGLCLALSLIGCGDDGGGNTQPQDAAIQDSTTIDMPAGGLTLTSPAFTAGSAIPAAYTCSGANTSPQLTWTGAPSGTLSFAVVLTDLSLTPPLVHWAIYDIPSTETGIPANVDKAYEPANVPGAHQAASFDNQTRGYLGPCPPNKHNYQFAVYAIFAATLPGSTMQTTAADAAASITAHQLSHAYLLGNYMK